MINSLPRYKKETRFENHTPSSCTHNYTFIDCSLFGDNILWLMKIKPSVKWGQKSFKFVVKNVLPCSFKIIKYLLISFLVNIYGLVIFVSNWKLSSLLGFFSSLIKVMLFFK